MKKDAAENKKEYISLHVIYLFIWSQCKACGILSPLSRDRTHALCSGITVLTTGPPEKSGD